MISKCLGSIGVCPQWEDTLDGKERRLVKIKGTEIIYGHTTKDSNNNLRSKFLIVSVEILIGVIVRIVDRFLLLIVADFRSIAIEQAKKECSKRNYALFCDKKDEIVSEKEFDVLVRKKILWQLIKSIVQLVTYPIAYVGLQLSALYGILDPLNGRYLFAKIEDMWSTDHSLTRDITIEDPTFNHWHMWIRDYGAPCMQPKDVLDSKNLYTMMGRFPSYEQAADDIMRQDHEFLRMDKELYEEIGIVFDCRVFWDKEDSVKQLIVSIQNMLTHPNKNIYYLNEYKQWIMQAQLEVLVACLNFYTLLRNQAVAAPNKERINKKIDKLKMLMIQTPEY